MDEETNFVMKLECENIFTGKIVMIIGILIQGVSKKILKYNIDTPQR